MDVEVVTLDSFPYLRRVLWGSLIRTVLRYAGICLGAGVAMLVLGYLVYGESAQFGTFFLGGLFVASPSLYLAARWAVHFSLQLRQLAKLEGKVRTGESIPISEMGFHVYGVRTTDEQPARVRAYAPDSQKRVAFARGSAGALDITRQEMTRAELADRYQSMNRRSWWIFGPWLLVFMGTLWLLSRTASDEPVSTAGLIAFFSWLTLNLASIIFVYFRLMRCYGLVCSRCDKVLNARGLELALSAGVCNRCNERFLQDGRDA